MPGGHLSTKKWYWTDTDGTVHEEVGLHLICDGGYHLWKILMCPFKHQPEGTDATIWSKWIESLRKDVECVFGILKKRFMVLKHAARFKNIETLGMVFRTCCILHNMLLDFDGLDDWEDFTEDDIDVENLNESHFCTSRQSYSRQSGLDPTLVDGVVDSNWETNDQYCDSFTSEDFYQRRDGLIEHFTALKKV